MSSRPGIDGLGLMKRAGLVPVLLLAVSACGPRDAGEQVEEASEPGAEPAAAQQAQTLPEASAEAVLAYLTAADFRNSWDLWPGKGEKYEGTEPHGALLTTYLNPAAAQAAADGAGQMPPGAIVVKDNFMPDGMLGASTVMYKIEGYNPEAGDWWWAKFMPDGTVDMDGMAQGRVEMCIGCHAKGADNDYLLTGSIAGQ
jgi:hypothetical protein